MEWDGVLIFIAIITAVVTWLRWNYSHWKNKGIPYVEPSIIFGNFREMTLGKVHMGVLTKRYYDMFPGEPAVGVYMMRSPLLIVKDLDLIKSILVTNFSSFTDNGLHISKEADPVLGLNPFFLKGDEWREARKKHTHNHTAAKLKTLFGYVEEVKDELIDYINHNLEKKFDAQDFCKRFTTDVVSSCVFGVKTRSHAGEDSEFKKQSEKMVSMNWRIIFWGIAPGLFRRLKLPLLSKKISEFFSGIVEEVVETRKKNNLSRSDFLQNLISDKTEEFSLLEMTAQALTFFVDGYLTSATEMSFIMYMLAIHPEIQQRLRDEINGAKELDYETVHSLPYLDAVFNETLRIYPAAVDLSRVCNEDITLTAKNRTLELKVGDRVDIPIYAIHRDPEHFPEPLKFDPERFLQQPNHPALLTFGAGPRACFGQRFAKTQIKAGVAHLVKNFRVSPGGDDHSMPSVTNNKSILITPDTDMSIVFSKL